MKRVLLAGEGPNELGDWFKEPAFRGAPTSKRERSRQVARPSVLEALLRKAQPEGWQVVEGRSWKDIRKFKAGNHMGAEARNVLGLLNEAYERKLDAVVFSRDRDGDAQRAKDLQEGLRQVSERLPAAPPWVGGMAIERLESWIAAVLGTLRTEETSDTKVDEILDSHGIEAKDGAAMVEAIEREGLERIPDDAHSLREWLDQGRRVLGGESS